MKNRKTSDVRYDKSSKGKTRHARYRKSPKGKAQHARYRKSKEGKEQKRWGMVKLRRARKFQENNL